MIDVARIGRVAALTVAIATTSAASATVRSAAAPVSQRSFGPGRCGPVDPAFAGLANATGGQVILLSPSEPEAASSVAIRASVITGSSDTALLVSATGTASDVAGPRSFAVDGSARRLVITSTFDNTGGTLEVFGPDEAAVEANERTQDARLNCGRTLIIDRPDAGVWRASLSPTGRFWLRVHAVSDFDLMTAEFVESGGPLTHGGTFKIAGQPVAGRPATLSVGVFGPAMKSYEFALLSEQGRVITQVTPTQVGERSWEGTVDVPAEPFRVAVSGVDQSGMRYQRSSKLPFHSELVDVRAVGGPVALLQAGSESRVAFTIRNAGPDSATYRIVATDDRRLVSRVEPATLDLDAGAEQQITVWLKVPPGTVTETADVLTVTASSTGLRRTSNSAAMYLGIRE